MTETKTLESKAVHENSRFAQKCRRYGLDPQKTSTHRLICAIYGLDPKISVLDLACIRFNIPEGQRTLYNAKKLIGEDWVHQTYKLTFS